MKVTKKEFWKTMTAKDVVNAVNTGSVCGFIVGVMTLVVAIISKAPLTMVEGFVIILLACGVAIFRSRVCAVLLMGDYIVSRLILLISGGLFSANNIVGHIAITITIVSGFYSGISGTFQFQKNWKLYLIDEYTGVPFSETKTLSQIAKMSVNDDPNE